MEASVLIYSTAGNISEEKGAESALSASESLLASVLESSQDGIMAFQSVRDAAGAIVDFVWILANPRAGELMQRDASALLGKRLRQELPPMPGLDFFDGFVHVVENGTPFHKEIFLGVAGLRAWYQMTAVKLNDGFAVTFHDITQQREAEEMRLAMATAKMGTWELDLTTYEVKRSLTTDELFGLPADGSSRKIDTYMARIHPDDRPDFQKAIDGWSVEQPYHTIEYRVIQPDGSIRWMSSRGMIIVDDNGKVRRKIGALTDITAHKENKAALEERARQQAVIATLGQQALTGTDLHTLMQNVVALVTDTLNVEYGKILELLPDGNRLLLRSGIGWNPTYVVGEATLSAGLESQAGYALRVNDPVIVEDCRLEDRFAQSPLLEEHNIVSGLSVVITGRKKPYGVLSVHTTQPRSFSSDQVNFLHSVANLLAMTLERRHAELEQVRLLDELRTAHAQREHSLVQLRAIFDSMSEGLVIINPDGTIHEMNPAALALHGYTSQAEAQLHLHDHIDQFVLSTPEGTPLPLEEWPVSRALCQEQFRTQEVCVRHKRTGAEWIGSYSGMPVYDSNGRFLFAVLTIRDVTEQKQAEQAIQASEARFRGTFENAAVGMAQVTLDGRWIRINERMCQIVGYSAEELLGDMTFHDISHPDDLAEDLRLLDQLINNEIQSYQMEKRYFHKDGHVVWINLTAALERDKHGTPIQAISVIEDITDRKEAEEALRESEVRFRVMAETLPAILFTCQANGAIDYINRRFEDYTGISAETVLGVRWTSVIHAEDLQRHRHDWQQAMVEGLTFENEFRLCTQDGSYRWFMGRAHPIHDETEQVVRWVGTCTDIQDQKMAEEALRQSEQQLRLFNESLEERVQQRTRQVRELASALTLAEQRERRRVAQILHDHVQQMLYGIQMRNHLLKLDTEPQTQPLILEHIGVMNDLVEQAIRSTRSLAVELSPPVLRNEGLAAAFEWLAGNMREMHGLAVETHLHNDYQPASEDLRVLVFQVTRELLFNVVKHANVDRAQIEMYEKGANIVVCVTDEGSGFEPDLVSVKQSPEGGFGLYSIQERLALFGGHLVLKSQRHKGTTATIVVPHQPSMPFRQDPPQSNEI